MPICGIIMRSKCTTR